MGNNPSFFKGAKDRPVEQVSWDDVTSSCAVSARVAMAIATDCRPRRNGNTRRGPGRRVLCRTVAGSDGLVWSGRRESAREQGNDPSGRPEAAERMGFVRRSRKRRGTSGRLVQPQYYKTGLKTTTGPASGEIHIARGGSWYSNASYVRLAEQPTETVAVLRRRDVGIPLRAGTRPLVSALQHVGGRRLGVAQDAMRPIVVFPAPRFPPQ